MIYGFYFRFYGKFHNSVFSSVLAKLAYMLYCCVFFLKKLRHKRVSVDVNIDDARNIVNGIHPRLDSHPVYENKPIDDNIDLSIVVPVYNYVDIIESNIDSILNQKTEYNYQLIIVDDGSTDGAADVLKKYADNPNVKLIFQKKPNLGLRRAPSEP